MAKAMAIAGLRNHLLVVVYNKSLNDTPDIKALRTRALHIITSKLIQVIRNDRKRKETRGDTDGTIILFLYPLIFDTKMPGD